MNSAPRMVDALLGSASLVGAEKAGRVRARLVGVDAARGAALLGMTALGMLDSLDRAAELVQVTETQQPDRRATEIYAQLLPIFDQAFESLAGAFDALAAIEGMAPVSRPDAS